MMRLGHADPRDVDDPAEGVRADCPTSSRRSQRYAKLFDLGAIGEQLGYPLFMKPYDGGGWRGVSRIDDEAALRRRYEESGKLVMHLQAAVRAVRPLRALHRPRAADARSSATTRARRCTTATRWTQDFVTDDEAQLLRDITLTINAFFGWDFNSCEALRKDGVWYPIDFANPCPDSQVTSLHYHFPWLVKANLALVDLLRGRPSGRCARTLDWEPFYEIAAARPAVSREARAPTRRSPTSASRPRAFEEFCAKHLGAPRRGRLGVLRHADARKDAVRAEGRGAVPRARGRAVHRAVLEAHPGVARGRRSAGRDERAKTTSRAGTRERAAARGHAGALGHVRPAGAACSRPPAATPRRSSAST